MPISHTDNLLQKSVGVATLVVVPGVWVRLLSNNTAVNYYSTAASDVNGAFTHSAPPDDYSLYYGSAATVPGTPTLANAHYAVPVTAGDDIAAKSYTAVSSSPYVPSAPAGGGLFQNFHGIRMVNQFAGADLGAKITAADADLGSTKGELWIESGTYTLSTAPTISANHVLRFFGGTITCTVTGGVDVFSLPNASAMVGSGFGSDQTSFVIGAAANISRFITNKARDGTQEYFYIQGIQVIDNIAATVSVAVIDLVSVFVNSLLRDVVVSCADANHIALRIASVAAGGAGPVLVENCWFLSSSNDLVYITDNSGSLQNVLLNHCTIEHWGNGKAGIHLVGTGGLFNTHAINTHMEQNKNTAAATQYILIDGAANTTIDELFLSCAGTAANKTGIQITNNANNVRIRIDTIHNYLSTVNPILSDLKNNVTIGGTHIFDYTTPDAFKTAPMGFGSGALRAFGWEFFGSGAASANASRDIMRMNDTDANAANIGAGIGWLSNSTYAAAIRPNKVTGAGDTANDLLLFTRAAGSSDVAEAFRATSTGALLASHDIRRSRQTPTEAVLVSGVDANLGEIISVTLTAARLVGAPLNPLSGQHLTFEFTEGGAGGFAVTWNAVFKKTWADTGNTTGKISTITFYYNGTNWVQTGAQAPYV